MILLVQSFAPGDCLLTGLCSGPTTDATVPPGLLFLALGLVLYGAFGLWRARPTGGPSASSPPPPPVRPSDR